VLDCPILETRDSTLRENYHLRTVQKKRSRPSRAATATVFDSFGPHHRLSFPSTVFSFSRKFRRSRWDPLQTCGLYACSETSCCRADRQWRSVRVYPADVPAARYGATRIRRPGSSDESTAEERRRSSTTRTDVRYEGTTRSAGLAGEHGVRVGSIWCSARNEAGLGTPQNWVGGDSRQRSFLYSPVIRRFTTEVLGFDPHTRQAARATVKESAA